MIGIGNQDVLKNIRMATYYGILTFNFFSVPPSTPIIVEKQQGVVRGADVGPFEIGGSLIVTCKVFGGIIILG